MGDETYHLFEVIGRDILTNRDFIACKPSQSELVKKVLGVIERGHHIVKVRHYYLEEDSPDKPLELTREQIEQIAGKRRINYI